MPSGGCRGRTCAPRRLVERDEKKALKTRPLLSRRRPPPAAAGSRTPPASARCRRWPRPRFGIAARNPSAAPIRGSGSAAALLPPRRLAPRPAVLATVEGSCFRQGFDGGEAAPFVWLPLGGHLDRCRSLVVVDHDRVPSERAPARCAPPCGRHEVQQRLRQNATDSHRIIERRPTDETDRFPPARARGGCRSARWEPTARAPAAGSIAVGVLAVLGAPKRGVLRRFIFGQRFSTMIITYVSMSS